MYDATMRIAWLFVLVACGESTVADVGLDAGRDAATDSSAPDARADATRDVSVDGAGADTPLNTPADAGVDADIDGACGVPVDDSPIAFGTCASPPATAEPVCPDAAPDSDALTGACCYRESNEGRAPELRVSALRFSTPATLSAGLVRSAINDAIDDERMNWLIRFEALGDLVEMGHGFRNSDNTFSFACGDAPSPGDPGRLDPRRVTLAIEGDAFATAPATRLVIATMGVGFELPFRHARVECANLSFERTCVGQRNGAVYQTEQGSIEAYITIEDAIRTPVVISPIDTSLCNFLAGMAASGPTPCTEIPPPSWPVPPNALCDATGCSSGCSADVCNAWRAQAGFGAHGVEIR